MPLTDIRFRNAVDRDAYYADGLCDGIATLNQSSAHLMLSRSPKHAWAAHPLLGGRRRKASSEMTLGTILDEVLLGGERGLEVIECDAFRTNAAKAARDAALAAGKVPVKSGDMAEYREIAERTRKNLYYAGVELDEFERQVLVLWTETASNGNAVQCRGLLDMLDSGKGIIADLKTTENARPDALGAKCIRFGYHIQAAAYTSAIEHVYPDLAGRVRFQNIWLETEWPNVVTVSEPDGEMMQLGRVQWQRAIDLWEECSRTGKWPAYTTPGEVVRVEPPSWAVGALIEEVEGMLEAGEANAA
jgi:hypothetical protein